MLRIRDEQMRALRQPRNASACRVALDEIQRDWLGYLRVGGAPLEELVAAQVDKAASYGLLSERQLVVYAVMAAIHGPRFDASPFVPWVREVLAERHAHPRIVGPMFESMARAHLTRLRRRFP
jgi:hypothetical protein